MDILYNDCDAARAAELDKYMVPHAPLAFETKPSAPAWADKGFDGRRGYVRTADDACNPASLQDMWLQKSNVEWDVAHFQTGHMPFVSQPKALASQIDKFIKAFAAALIHCLALKLSGRFWSLEHILREFLPGAHVSRNRQSQMVRGPMCRLVLTDRSKNAPFLARTRGN
ncbi:hypothetical protein ANO11243_053450 [Dothideomycetidae sp. 11243]|nr:hypothetical protein ANO11243_053450 [fungal sp. No.11243]